MATPADGPIPADVDLSVQHKIALEPVKRKGGIPAKSKATPDEVQIHPGLTNKTQTDVPSVDQLLRAQQDPASSLAVRRGPPRKGKRSSEIPDYPGVPTRPKRDRRRPNHFHEMVRALYARDNLSY